jgi:hypothetical protein
MPLEESSSYLYKNRIKGDSMYSDGSLYNIEIIFNRLEMNFLGGRRL